MITVLLAAIFSVAFANKGCFREGCSFYADVPDLSDVPTPAYRFDPCFNLTCEKGRLIFRNIDPKCAECILFDDPRLHTFDGLSYGWHGLCNYTLSQPPECNNCSSYNPKFAIYSDFADCEFRWSGASCLDCTTYKIDANTVVTIEHKTKIPFSLEINGNEFSPLPYSPTLVSDCINGYYKAIVWRDYSCAYIVGLDFSIKACPTMISIYTRTRNMKRLVGLCGFYSGTIKDEFVPRGSCFNPTSLYQFATSWRTLNNKADCCPDNEFPSFLAEEKRAEECDLEQYREICTKNVQQGYQQCVRSKFAEDRDVEEAIMNCMKDCCLLPDTCEEWAGNAYVMAAIACETEFMKNGKKFSVLQEEDVRN